MSKSNTSRSNQPRRPNQGMGGGRSGLCLWRLSGRYYGSGSVMRGWTRSRPQMFEPQMEAEVDENRGKS